VVSLFLITQVPNASDQWRMAVLLRPFDCLSLRLEGGEDVVGVILDNIVVDGISLGATLGRGSI
jgi:hypothetical protein